MNQASGRVASLVSATFPDPLNGEEVNGASVNLAAEVRS